MELCICSTKCDAPVLDLLLDWHCRLVGAEATFVGEGMEDGSTNSIATTTPRSTATATESVDTAVAAVSDDRFSTLLHWAIKAQAMNWLTNVLIRTAARFNLADRLCMRQDSDGHTPLHLAVMLNAAPDVVQTLLVSCRGSRSSTVLLPICVRLPLTRASLHRTKSEQIAGNTNVVVAPVGLVSD